MGPVNIHRATSLYKKLRVNREECWWGAENPEGENEPPTKRSKKTDDVPVSEIDFTTIL